MRRSTSIWLVVMALGVSSLAAACYQLWSLPELSVYLSPELRVRSVSTTFPGWQGSTDLQRGDQVDAVEGQSVSTLADVQAILRADPAAGEENTGETTKSSTTATGNGQAKISGSRDSLRFIDVQVRRPLHRFTIALQREDANTGELPPGYNPATDRLLEIDGHPLPEPLGPEQLKSIIATRSQALLTFGRKGAVFQAKVPVKPTGFPWVPAVVFLCALGAAALLWRRHAQEHEPEVAAAIGLESVAFGWIGLLAFAYQWILADRFLATVIIGAMCLVRPLSMFARSRGPTRDSTEGLWALAIGGSFAVLLGILFNLGPLPRVEVGLFAAAAVGALAIVYEISVLGFDEGTQHTLAEGGGYLVAVLVVLFLCGFLAWLFDPTYFEEQLWRWFAVGIVGLVWFGDAMFTLRGPLSSTYGNVVGVADRRSQIADYLADVSDELPDSEIQLLFRTERGMVGVRLDRGEAAFEAPDDHLRDAIDILIQEDSRIPLSGAEDRSNHPLTGIALSMDIALALQLHPPEFGLILPETDIVLVAFERSGDGDVPSYASADVIDFAQARMDAATWVAVFVEGIRELRDVDRSGVSSTTGYAVETDSDETSRDDASADDGNADGGDADGAVTETGREDAVERIDSLEAEIQELEEKLQSERESGEVIREDRRELASRLQDHQRRWRERQPPVDLREELLEDDLLESMEYLVDGSEPVVIGGPFGAGKRFVGHCLADMDGVPAELVVDYDATAHAPDGHHEFLFDPDETGVEDREPMETDFASVAEDGALIVRAAGLLSDSVTLALCNQMEELEARLVLCIDDPEAHERSVLEGRPNNVVDRLGHRELVIPPLTRRPGILESVFDLYLDRYAKRLGRHPVELSTESQEWLSSMSYPAQMREVQLWMHRIVLEAGDHDVIDPEMLPEPIRPSEDSTES